MGTWGDIVRHKKIKFKDKQENRERRNGREHGRQWLVKRTGNYGNGRDTVGWEERGGVREITVVRNREKRENRSHNKLHWKRRRDR